MTARFFILALAMLLVTCGSKAFHPRQMQRRKGGVIYPFAVSYARQRVMPHLHYAVDMRYIDIEAGTVELSFFFVKEQGDSLLWVDCVERIPVSLVDTACSRTLYGYDYTR